VSDYPNLADFVRDLRGLADEYRLPMVTATFQTSCGEITVRLLRTQWSGVLVEMEDANGESRLMPAGFGR
jgi:hypothetical protein